MNVGSRRWGKTFFTSMAVILLTACIEIEEVRQPANGLPGVSFEVEIDVAALPECDIQVPTCTAIAFLRMPVDWVVESCSYTGDLVGACNDRYVGNPPSSAQAPPDATTEWRGFKGPTINPGDLYDNVRATLKFVIKPIRSGEYTLDYLLTAEGSSLIWGGKQSVGHRITIGSPANSIPTLGGYGSAVMALSLAGAALFQRRRLKQA